MAGGFDSLGLLPELIRAVDDMGWKLPSDVQDESIPLILGGGDVMVASETGSGKTAAFSLPMIQCVHERLRDAVSMGESRLQPPHLVMMSENDRDSIMMISNSGLRCESNAQKQWAGTRASHGIRKGKYYFECTVRGGGICRVGWSTKTSSLELGKDAHGYGYGGTAKKSHSNTFEDYGIKYGDGDCVGCYLDMDQGRVVYTVNGESQGLAFNLTDVDRSAVLFPAVLLKGCAVELNFGGSPFSYPPTPDVSSIVQAAGTDIMEASSPALHMQAGGKRRPMALILEPARDLAEQVYETVIALARHVQSPPVTAALLVGGDNSRGQKAALRDGVDIVVGTPGKVGDLVRQGALDLGMVHFFILDEADRLVEADSLSAVLELYNACPTYGSGEHRLQVCFFSATLHSPAITKLAGTICTSPTWVDLKGKDAVPETVHHCVCRASIKSHGVMTTSSYGGPSGVLDGVHLPNSHMSQMERNSMLIKEIKQKILVRIIDTFQMSQCLIFCRTNLDCDNLETFLCSQDGGRKFSGAVESGKEGRYSCAVLAGMRSMEERRQSLAAFKEGQVRFLICTDVAARGIDVAGLPYVINMTLPEESEQYIHRIGRVGRADRLGLAISIVAEDGVSEKVWWHTCGSKGRDGSCTRRALKSDGGCTVWFDEPEKLRAVEKRLDMGIPQLDPVEFTLPEELACKYSDYGEMCVDEDDGHNSGFSFELIKPAMQELASMEFQSQNIFLKLQKDFHV
mmetsp:Transcript_26416/g.39193  ORF Transcript_26416/g.39193 Transcript_26416/m.39193 type:complete len:741 (+) Transcript_26416:51-2273(+)